MTEPVDSHGVLFWVAPLPPKFFRFFTFFKFNCCGKMAWSSSHVQFSTWSGWPRQARRAGRRRLSRERARASAGGLGMACTSPPRPSSLKSFERCEIKEKSWISLRKTGGRAEGIVFPWEIGGPELILQWAALPRHSPVISFYGSYYFEFFQPLKNRNTIHSSEAAQKQGIGCLWPSGRWLTSAVKGIKR